MKFVPIFEHKSKAKLFALVGDDGNDVLNATLDFWNDPVLLTEYFELNSGIFQHYEDENITSVVMETIQLANKLEDLLESNIDNLDALFEKLDNKKYNIFELSKTKQKWLRLYAVKLEPNHYAIVGSAIKQSQTMDDNELTKAELTNLKKVRDLLIEEGIMDADSFKSVLFVLNV